MRRSVVVFGVLIVLAFILIGGPAYLMSLSTSEVSPAQEPGEDVEIVRPTDGDSGFYPYINAQPRFQQRSPINVVVLGETETVLEVLTRTHDANWEITTEEHLEADPDTHVLLSRNETVADANVTAEGDGGYGFIDAKTMAATGVWTQDNETAGNVSADNASADAVSAGNETASTVTRSNTSVNRTNATVGNLTATNATNDNRTLANESIVNRGITIGGTRITWTQATGAVRFAYVETAPGEGQWIEETMQIHDGNYYGHRHHIRMYESPNPDEPWVAMQAHSEHFDWFTLRHRVDGVQDAQSRLEADLMAAPHIDETENVRRIYLGNRNASDSDGWATFVDLLALALIGGLIGKRFRSSSVFERSWNRFDSLLTDTERARLNVIRHRVKIRHVLLSVLIVGIVVGVRLAGIALENTGWFTMHEIAMLLYPFIAIGLPAGTYLLARGLDRRMDAAVTAGASFAVAVWFDFTIMHVETIPIDVMFHRMLLVVALGMIAAGATHRADKHWGLNSLLLLGTAFWLVIVVGTLFGYL